MDLQLTGLRALVTGSSSGIGTGIASVLAREGAVVVVHGRDAARTAAVARKLKDGGATTHGVVGDLSTIAGCAAVVQAVEGEISCPP